MFTERKKQQILLGPKPVITHLAVMPFQLYASAGSIHLSGMLTRIRCPMRKAAS